MHVIVRHLVKKFGDFEASRDISFEIEKGKLIGLLGPSGGGKTTILRMIAGLDVPDEGEIYIHQTLVNHIRPQDRGIGFVFQNYALFKHMNVYDNIAFGLRIKKKNKKEIHSKVMELIELTGLNGLERRYPHQLSGGQRQRVAFARALAPEPQLLLLDEPFAAIDAKVRKELRLWLKEMIHRVGITSVFVTHDQEEAVEVADEIMIINHGRLEQKGTPVEIYQNPATPFVARFIGEANFLQSGISRIKGFENEQDNVSAVIRPEFIEIGREHEISFIYASTEGVVQSVSFRGTNFLIEVEVNDSKLFAYRSLEADMLGIGDRVRVLVHRMYLFNQTSSGMKENQLKNDPMPVHI